MKITAQSGSLIQTYPFAETIDVPGDAHAYAPILGVAMRGGEILLTFLLQQPMAPTHTRKFVVYADEEIIPNVQFQYHHYVGSILSKGLHVFELI